ncbi:ATP-dependent protease [Vibrio phage D260]
MNTQKTASAQQDLTEDRVLITVDTNEGNTRYNVYLDKAVDRPSEYRNLTEFLMQAKQGDKFRLYLNGPGGHMDSCVQLIHALANTLGTTEAHLLGEVNSAHSNIFMACDQHVVYPYSLMMVHTFSGGFGGKGHDSARASISYNELTANLYGDLYEGFLTDEELNNVLINNQDLYFHGQDIATRLGKVYELRDEVTAKQARETELDRRAQVRELMAEIEEAEAEEQEEAQNTMQEMVELAMSVDPEATTALIEEFTSGVVADAETSADDAVELGEFPSEPLYESEDLAQPRQDDDGDLGLPGLGSFSEEDPNGE